MLNRSYEALKTTGDGPLLMPVRVGGTRWIAHTLRAVTNIIAANKFIVAHLQQLNEMSEKVSSDAKAKARAFLKLLQSRSVAYFLYYMYLLDVLTPLSGMSKMLQNRQSVLGVQHAELSSTIDVINKYTDSNKLADWISVNDVMAQKFPNILPVIDLILSISPSSAEAERGFSQLKLLKTRLGTRMTQPVLNNLLCINLEAPDVEHFDPTDAVHNWNTSGVRMRRPMFKDNKSKEQIHSMWSTLMM
ncbi:uncharacterized protein LOC127832060 isoform X2 [Dreissena polymorpha]|uniref:uncharacterized protein LOC127832060 isoform X2 n=1 Tax=Dreissena polymorpha TaxID=45954 RepID=UPI002263BA28|nr:uncharacterized protein LOC127832060 isoform X2 [Dreissena polymorpha]